MPALSPSRPRHDLNLTGSPVLNALLLAVPVAIGLGLSHSSPLLVFIFSAVGLAGLAGVLSEATRELAAHLGPLAAGLLLATFGNATEIIISIVALRAGYIEVVKASLAGSIIGNLLVVLGLAMFVGGLGRDKQLLNRSIASTNATMLLLAAFGLVVPAVYADAVFTRLGANPPGVRYLSLSTAVILIIIYVASLYFQFTSSPQPRSIPPAPGEARNSPLRALLLTLAATGLIAVLSEFLVGELEVARHFFNGTDLFWGAVVFALIGNAAELGIAIAAARRNDMDLAMAIGVGSSLQIALLVTPVLVFVSLVTAHPMSLVFNTFEIVGVVVAVLIVSMIASDGETNWLEGAQLLAVYALLVAAFYFVPA